MKSRIFFLVIILFSISLNAQNPKYIFPMDIPMILSASFAELRPNHFHAGLDISTSGVIGVNVKSVADGYVSRIKLSPYGYGHGLYVTHYDGHTTVYGHLSEYAPKIDSVVRREQYRNHTFDVDYYPEKDEIVVKKGEIIALSGNTGGSGGPHLHFEVRDTETDAALNPLAFIGDVADNRAPEVYGIKVYPLDDSAQVGGKCDAKYFTLAEIQNKTIEGYGKLGFGINANDFFTVGGRPCGVVEVSLFDNGRLIFKSRTDTIPFELSRYINSFIDYADYQQTKRYIQKSFIEDNNRLNIFNTSDSFFVKPQEIHKMKYQLKDFVGNVKTVNFTIKGNYNPLSKPLNYEGQEVCWAKDTFFEHFGMTVLFKAGSFYKNEFINLKKNDSTVFKRPVYSVGTKYIPLQNEMKLSLPVPDVYKQLLKTKITEKQMFIARVGKKNTLGYVGGQLDSLGNLVVETRWLGDFVVAIDTIAPTVSSKNSSTLLTNSSTIMIGVADNFSGISKYNCFIDGEWTVFEFDYKNARLIAPVKKLNLASGWHTLTAKVGDPCENEKVFEWKFRIR